VGVRLKFSLSAVVVLGALIAASPVVSVGNGPRTTNDGVFTPEQVKRGDAAYRKNCSRCHLDDLVGSDRTPPLAGETFFDKWIGGDMNAFVDRVRSMPEDAPASLSDAEYVDIAAFILNANGVPPGAEPLPAERAALKAIKIEKPK
jgi:S-disulfanyl-L-cysteine oxidoreductase SoxD